MNEALANAIIELARYAVMAYAIKNTRDVLIHALDKTSATPTEQSVLDAARAGRLDLHQLAQKVEA